MSTPSTTAPLLGAVLADRYELVRHIARGGMGDVYEAQDRLLRRQVAVKVFRATAPADRDRFDAEVTTLAALNHPSLVQVYDAGEHGGDGYVVLELVDGPTLRAVLAERGTVPPDELARLMAPVAAALAHVHDAGVVHRDVSPANVLCGADGRPRLADFGIARLLDTSRITAVATTVGTAAYMAPEQVEGRDVTPSADVYALGLVLLEGLTGRPAFPGAGHEAAIARLVSQPDTTTGVPAEWQPLLADMTARDPGGRPSAAAVAERLDHFGAADTARMAAARGAGAAAVGAGVGSGSSAGAGAVVVGDGEVDAGAATAVVPAVDGAAAITGGAPAAAPPGSTTVMPAALAPTGDRAAPPAPGSVPAAAADRSRRALWIAAGSIAAVMLTALAAQGDDGLTVPPPTTEPVAVTVPPTEPPTTLPPTTEEPDKDEGKGKGKDKREDDD